MRLQQFFQIKQSRCFAAVLSTLYFFCLLGLIPCFAQQNFYAQAIKKYQARRFAEAALLFKTYIYSQLQTGVSLASQLPEIKDKPYLVQALFCEAVCLEQINDNKEAAAIYKLLAERYTGTNIGSEAKKAMAHPNIARLLGSELGGTTRSAALDTLPKETWIPFKRYGSLMLVEGTINGQKTNMLFDTGASGCLFSMSQLRSLKIPVPTGKPTGIVSGVGNQGVRPAWVMYPDICIGRILRRQFPIQVSENASVPYPLLGTNFLQGMEYTIDSAANTIQFKAIKVSESQPAQEAGKYSVTVDAASHYVYSVPFHEINRALVVTVKIDGKDCKVMIDTGASMCMFTNSQIKAMGLKPRFTGKFINTAGVNGIIKVPVCSFDNAEFGPIKKTLVCTIADQTNLPFPLLGQNFLTGWDITVDHASHLVKLIRK